MDISNVSGDRSRNLEEKVGISRHPLDPRTVANHSVNCSGSRSSIENWRGRRKGRKAPLEVDSQGRWDRRLPIRWSGDGSRCSSGAHRFGTCCRVVRHGSARVRPCLPSTWPRGAWAVSAVRLLGVASRPVTDGWGTEGQCRCTDAVGGDAASIRHGSSSSLHRSHSSSSVLWEMQNGPAMAALTWSPTSWASSSVG